MSKKKTYAFSEIEQYRDHLEIKNLLGKNTIVSVVFLVLLAMTLTYMIIGKYPAETIVPLVSGFLLVLIISFVMSAYGVEDHNYLKFNKYLLTLGMFSIVTAMIIIFQSPSLIPLLFVVYGLAAIYQDLKVILISNAYFIFTMVFVVANFPEMLNTLNTSTLGTQFNITLFSILFLVMLTISSYIIMKEKSFFYNQISKSKEVEYRNIDLLQKLKFQTHKEDKDVDSFYGQVNEFLEAFSQKLELPNIFQERLEILKDLDLGKSYDTILEVHPDFEPIDLDRLSKLRIINKSPLSRIAVKLGKTYTIDIKRREIFSATHFKTLNKQGDPEEIRIIAFVIFYVALKKGLVGLNKISDEQIYQMIINTDYYYNIDSRVMKIYQENPEVFDAIIADAFQSGGASS
ncbi:MAG: hypothetical protein JXB08_00545 [Bacilli bacterium]|nr:hypothetical protein [Bacilli bacterium]